MMSEIDIVKAITKKNNNAAAVVLGRMPGDIRKDLLIYSKAHQFHGQGQKNAEVLDISGTYKLIMALPGENAKRFRVKIIHAIVEKLKEMGQETFLEDTLNEKLKEHALTSQAEDDGPITEYIYAMQSAAFPDLIKIGRTCDITKRLQNAKTFTAPNPFYLVALTPTLDSVRDEKKAHDHFADKRDAGEFFRITPVEITTYFQTVILPVYNTEMNSGVTLGKRTYDEI